MATAGILKTYIEGGQVKVLHRDPKTRLQYIAVASANTEAAAIEAIRALAAKRQAARLDYVGGVADDADALSVTV